MPREIKTVTETEFAILNVLWDRGPTTVRKIVEAVYGEHTHSLHASVKSLLERLGEKEFVVCERHGGAHLFSATVERKAFVAQQLQVLADSNFGGSLTPLLTTLIDNVKLARKDREAIRKILESVGYVEVPDPTTGRIMRLVLTAGGGANRLEPRRDPLPQRREPAPQIAPKPIPPRGTARRRPKAIPTLRLPPNSFNRHPTSELLK